MPVPTGYPDWQRVANRDLPGQLGQGTGVTVPGGGISSGTQDVSRYHSIGVRAAPTGQPVLLTVAWFNDSGATLPAGSRLIVLHPSITRPAQLFLRNLGPYLVVTFQGLPSGGLLSWSLFATDRDGALEAQPQFPYLIKAQTLSIAASGTQDVFPTDYYAGPFSCSLIGITAGFFADLYVYDTTATINLSDGFAMAAAGRVTGRFIAPLGAWFIRVTNGGAGLASVALSALYSTTGAT